MSETKRERLLGRLVAALAGGAALTRPTEADGRAEVLRGDSRVPIVSVPDGLVREAVSRGLLGPDAAGELRATDAGKAYLKRRLAAAEPFRRQHLDVTETWPPEGAGRPVAVVDNESPLAWLSRRRGGDGRPLITETQLLAGERLRRDYHMAGLMPRLGVDLTRAPSPRGQAGVVNRVADTVDTAIAARERVNLAMAFLGRELGSLLVEVCCDLVGLEDAEKRRRWPRRSGKIVLGVGLDRLAEHYGLSEAAQGPERSGGLRRWGAEGYRPSVDP